MNANEGSVCCIISRLIGQILFVFAAIWPLVEFHYPASPTHKVTPLQYGLKSVWMHLFIVARTTVGGYTYKLKADQMASSCVYHSDTPTFTPTSAPHEKMQLLIHLNGITVLTQQGSWQRFREKITQECQILQQRNVTSSSKTLHWPITYKPTFLVDYVRILHLIVLVWRWRRKWYTTMITRVVKSSWNRFHCLT